MQRIVQLPAIQNNQLTHPVRIKSQAGRKLMPTAASSTEDIHELCCN